MDANHECCTHAPRSIILNHEAVTTAEYADTDTGVWLCSFKAQQPGWMFVSTTTAEIL